MRIALVLTALALAAHPGAAQSRGAQVATGLGLASLGAYAAFADGDCSRYRFTVLQNGRCEWRTLGGEWVGMPPDRPRRQMAAGLAVAGVGGLIASGAWESRAVDALAAAGAGFMLLAVARNENYVPGTIHVEGDDGRWFTDCPHGSIGLIGAVYDPSDPHGGYDLPECRHTSFNRLNAMWSGVAALGLAASRWLWRDEPAVNIEVRPGAVGVSKTIEF